MSRPTALEGAVKTFWKAARRARSDKADDLDLDTLDLFVRHPALPRYLHVAATDVLGEAREAAEAARGRDGRR